ncbi:MAG: aminoglycoside phosphotransferase family protein [Planctomycetota bacterium]
MNTVAAQFDVTGDLIATEPLIGGHINDSFILTYQADDRQQRYLLQRINDTVFPHPEQVIENIQHVTSHIAQRLNASGVPDVTRRVLTLVHTRAGALYYRDVAGAVWRLYHYITDTCVHQAVKTAEQAQAAGSAFGEFQQLLADYSGPRLHETIPDFHHTPRRYSALDEAVRLDACGRVAMAHAELDFAQAQRSLAGALLDLHAAGELPERIVHNDAKISNVLFDNQTGVALCVVDLDTVMPGLAIYDFGDMVRSMATTTAEDETDLARVEVRMPLFEGLARGYLKSAGGFLTAAERDHLVVAGQLITLEQGVRFLTDYLQGDTYYKTRRPEQNLDRCRTQFKLLESIERQEALMIRVVESL